MPVLKGLETVSGDWSLLFFKNLSRGGKAAATKMNFQASSGVRVNPNELGEDVYHALDEAECGRLEKERAICFLVDKEAPAHLWFSSAVGLLLDCIET